MTLISSTNISNNITDPVLFLSRNIFPGTKNLLQLGDIVQSFSFEILLQTRDDDGVKISRKKIVCNVTEENINLIQKLILSIGFKTIEEIRTSNYFKITSNITVVSLRGDIVRTTNVSNDLVASSFEFCNRIGYQGTKLLSLPKPQQTFFLLSKL